MRRNLQTFKLLPNNNNKLILSNNSLLKSFKPLINSNNSNNINLNFNRRNYSLLSNNQFNSLNKMTGIKEVLAKIVPGHHSRSNSTDVSTSATPIVSTPT